MILSPSLLAADFGRLKEELDAIASVGVTVIHMDVMDGVFVPNISYGLPVIASLRDQCELFFDVHLMIVKPETYVLRFAEAGADLITFHHEAADDPLAVIDLIRSTGKKVGISIEPDTPFEAVAALLPFVDLLLVMTVVPGFGGQKLRTDCVEKVAAADQWRVAHNSSLVIEVDGGVTVDSIQMLHEAGADIVVAGSAVFTRGKTGQNAAALLRQIAECEPRRAMPTWLRANG